MTIKTAAWILVLAPGLGLLAGLLVFHLVGVIARRRQREADTRRRFASLQRWEREMAMRGNPKLHRERPEEQGR